CSSFTSATWHFAGGDANGEDRLAYILYNPTSTDAVIDISFTDQTGPENPNEFQAIFVPAGRLAVADVTSRFFGDSQIAATVKCRLGQIVAFQMELHPSAPASTTSAVPPAGSGGVSVLLGAPSTGPDWYFPEGVTSQNIPEDIYLYNPGATAAKVQISAYLDAGSASPIMVEVPAQGELDVALNQEARIPRSINHYFYIHVTKGPPIVAFQSMGTPVPSASPTQVAVAGSNQSAHPWINMNLGIRKAFREWVAGGTPLQFTGAVNSNSSDLGKGSAVAGSQQGAPILDRVPNASGFRETLIVANPGNSTISFSVAYLERGHASSVPGMADETVSAGGHDYLQLPPAAMPSVAPGGDFEVAATLPGVLVIAEGPITVVQEWTSQGIPGWTSSAAIPVSG
ncbi:MAG TPA: DUF5719 family protein, partial [Acidimicrobiales bacterium]|nr:DUF5719 family protein [Acidimicrobiales bacterium]